MTKYLTNNLLQVTFKKNISINETLNKKKIISKKACLVFSGIMRSVNED